MSPSVVCLDTIHSAFALDTSHSASIAMDQVDDVEALPPQPQDQENESIDEQRPRPFFTRRKKIVAAAVSVALVAAISIGAALGGSKPNQQTTGQAAVVQSDDPGDQSEPAEDILAGGGLPADESSPDQAREQANESAEGALADDESMDVIIDVGYSAEYPDDLIYDAGSERPEVPADPTISTSVHETPVEEKVPMFDNDGVPLLNFETVDFEGPVSDFIVADLSRMSVTTSSTCKNANEGVWKMDLNTDSYPWETYWSLTNSKGVTVAAGPPAGRNYARTTRYVGQLCLPQGQYKMAIGDKNGDGHCCKYGNGKMTVRVNGKKVAETDDTPFSLKEYNIAVTPLRGDNNAPPPTPKPSRKPTPKPTPEPTVKPITPSTGIQKCVDVIVKTDSWAFETGYQFVDTKTNEVLLSEKKGDMENNKTYRNRKCVEDGRYRLTVTDPFQGIQGDGYFAVEIDDQQIMYADKFQGGSVSYDILVGYEPDMTANEREWLDIHNRLRKEFHEANGKTFRPLVWNEQLAKESGEWVDQLLTDCKIQREPGLNLGENMSARSAISPRDEGAEVIMYRWTNKESKGYPLNQSMTQVYWYGSRQVGCSEKVMERANGQLCYASICRYARAGNCAVATYSDWKEATLTERSLCGPVCVNDECY